MIERIRKQGFTLVELLVVISIISLLMSILVPCLAKAKSIAKRTVCKANLHSAAVGFRMYLDDNNGIMPPAARYPSLGLNDKNPIAEFLKPFIGDTKALHCPADNGYIRPDYTERYFESEGASYEYNEILGGRRVEDTYLTEDLGFNERDLHVLYDYDHFHGRKGEKDSVNYLYSDGHVGDRTGD